MSNGPGVRTGNGINDDAELSEGPGVGTDDSPEIVEGLADEPEEVLVDGAGLREGSSVGTDNGLELIVGVSVRVIAGLYEGLDVGTVSALLTHSSPNG